MPTFSQSLEQSLHRALAIANERHHQYATLEHLLLSLIDDSDAAAVMRACSVDLDKLRTMQGLFKALGKSWHSRPLWPPVIMIAITRSGNNNLRHYPSYSYARSWRKTGSAGVVFL